MKYSIETAIKPFSLSLVALLMVLTPMATFAAGDPTGDWTINVDMGGTPVPATLVVTKNEDGSLAGKLDSPLGQAELENVKFEGDKLSFTQTFGEGDTALEFTFNGVLDGDSFEGMLVNETMGEMKVTGTRGGGDSFYGTWEITSDSQLGELVRTLIVKADGTGTYNDFEITDFSLDGKAVSFSVSIDVQGQEMPLDCEGTYEGKTFTGNFNADGNSVAELTGKQTKGAGPDLSKIAGKYDAEVDAQGQMITGVITIADSSGNFEGMEFTEITFDGTALTYHMDYDADGQVIPVDFEGTVSDTEMKGDFSSQGAVVASMVATKQ
jgi:hypothetical protein